MTACGSASGKSSNNNDQGQQQGPPGKPTIKLTADPQIISGDESTSRLSWTSTNATSINIQPLGTFTDANGAIDVGPEDTTTYTATATGPGGVSEPSSVTVTVAKELTLLFQANPSVITPGQSANLTWSTKGALSLSIDNNIGSVTPVTSGSTSVSPTVTTTYIATANGTNSQVLTSKVTVTVQPVIVNLSVSNACINSGQSTTLNWTSTSAASINIDNGVGDVMPPSGSVSVSPAATTTYTATASDSSSHTATSQVTVQVGDCGGINQVKHIILFMQENRSFDNYFGVLGAYRASKGFSDDVDGFDPNKGLPDRANPSNLIKPYHFRTQCTKLVTPGWNESHYDVHYSASTNSYQSSATPMEGFLKTTNSFTVDENGNDQTGERAMGYYDQTDLPYYYALATEYATSDRWFSAVLGPTIPNRMYLMTGSSFGFIRPDQTGHTPYPQKTFFRALTEAGISWKYYYQDNSTYLYEFADWATEQGKVRNISEYYNILAGADADSKLPQVIFIERASQLGLDEHPHGVGVQFGAANTKKIIDALMNSTAWKSSVFILYYDEGGGFHDHVPPIAVTPPDSTPPNLRSTDRTGDFATSGFRTPLIIASPFAKPHYLSHTPIESTSVWKFIETRFGMSPLTGRDANANDMTEFFDFVSPPRVALPSLPDQPTSAPCDRTLQTDPNQP
jgi:phospholipase C